MKDNGTAISVKRHETAQDGRYELGVRIVITRANRARATRLWKSLLERLEGWEDGQNDERVGAILSHCCWMVASRG